MELIVEIDRSFGRETIRPACPVSEKFCRLLKQRTLTREDVELIKQLGYTVKVKEIVL